MPAEQQQRTRGALYLRELRELLFYPSSSSSSCCCCCSCAAPRQQQQQPDHVCTNDRIIFVTGAGLSAACGLPLYRGNSSSSSNPLRSTEKRRRGTAGREQQQLQQQQQRQREEAKDKKKASKRRGQQPRSPSHVEKQQQLHQEKEEDEQQTSKTEKQQLIPFLRDADQQTNASHPPRQRAQKTRDNVGRGVSNTKSSKSNSKSSNSSPKSSNSSSSPTSSSYRRSSSSSRSSRTGSHSLVDAASSGKRCAVDKCSRRRTRSNNSSIRQGCSSRGSRSSSSDDNNSRGRAGDASAGAAAAEPENFVGVSSEETSAVVVSSSCVIEQKKRRTRCVALESPLLDDEASWTAATTVKGVDAATGKAAAAVTGRKESRVVWCNEAATDSSSNTGRSRNIRRDSGGRIRGAGCSSKDVDDAETRASAVSSSAAAAGAAEWWGQVSTFAALREKWYTEFWYRVHDPRSARSCFFSIGHAVLALLLLLRPTTTLLLTQNVDRLHHAAAVFLAPRLAAAAYTSLLDCMRAGEALSTQSRVQLRIPPAAEQTRSEKPARVYSEATEPTAAAAASRHNAHPSLTTKTSTTASHTATTLVAPSSPSPSASFFFSSSSSSWNTCLSNTGGDTGAGAWTGADGLAVAVAAAAEGGATQPCAAAAHAGSRSIAPVGRSPDVLPAVCDAATENNTAIGAAAIRAPACDATPDVFLATETAASNSTACTTSSDISAVLIPQTGSFGGRYTVAPVTAIDFCPTLHEEERDPSGRCTAGGAAESTFATDVLSPIARHGRDATVSAISASVAAEMPGEEYPTPDKQAIVASPLFHCRLTAEPYADSETSATCTCETSVDSGGAPHNSATAVLTSHVGTDVLTTTTTTVVSSGAAVEVTCDAEVATAALPRGMAAAPRCRAAAALAVRDWLAPRGGWWGLGRPLHQSVKQQAPRTQNLHCQVMHTQEQSGQQKCYREAQQSQQPRKYGQKQQREETESERTIEQSFEKSLRDDVRLPVELHQRYCVTAKTFLQKQSAAADVQQTFVTVKEKNTMGKQQEAAEQQQTDCRTTAAGAAASSRYLVLPPGGRIYELHGCMYSYRCSGLLPEAATLSVVPQAKLHRKTDNSCSFRSTTTSSRENISRTTCSCYSIDSRTSYSTNASSSASSEDSNAPVQSTPYTTPKKAASSTSSRNSSSRCHHVDQQSASEQQGARLATSRRMTCPFRHTSALDESEVIWTRYKPSTRSGEERLSLDATSEKEGRDIEHEDYASGDKKKVVHCALSPPHVGSIEDKSLFRRNSLFLNELPNASEMLLSATAPASTVPAVLYSAAADAALAGSFCGCEATIENVGSAQSADPDAARLFAAVSSAAAVVTRTRTESTLLADAGTCCKPDRRARSTPATSGALARDATTASVADSRAANSCISSPSVSASLYGGVAAAKRDPAARPTSACSAAGSSGTSCEQTSTGHYSCRGSCRRTSLDVADIAAAGGRSPHNAWGSYSAAAGSQPRVCGTTLGATDKGDSVRMNVLVKDVDGTGLQILQQIPPAVQKQLMRSDMFMLPVCPHCYSLCLPLCLWFDELLFFSHRAFQSPQALRAAFLFAGLFPVLSESAPPAFSTTAATSIPPTADPAPLTASTAACGHLKNAAHPADALPLENSATVAEVPSEKPVGGAALRQSHPTGPHTSHRGTTRGTGAAAAAAQSVYISGGHLAALKECAAAECGAVAADKTGQSSRVTPAANEMAKSVGIAARGRHQCLCTDRCYSGYLKESQQQKQQLSRTKCSWVFIGTSFSTASTDWLLLLRQEVSQWTTRAVVGARSSHEEQRVYNINCSSCLDACFEATDQQQSLIQTRLREAALFFNRSTRTASCLHQKDKGFLHLKCTRHRQCQQKSSSSGVTSCSCTSPATSSSSTLQTQACVPIGEARAEALAYSEMSKSEDEPYPQWLDQLPADFSAAGSLNSKSVLNTYRCKTMRRIMGDAQDILMQLCPPEVREWLARVYNERLQVFKSAAAGA